MSWMGHFDRLRAVLFVIGGMSIFFALTPQVTSAQQRDRQIYQTDSVGNVRYHAPSWAIQPDGRVIETNRYGEKMHHKQQYKIVGDQVMPVDSVGNPQPHKGGSTRR
jgi:hypothetical protein